MSKRRRRIFFGWWAVVNGSFHSLWGAGFHTYGFTALFKSIAAELGFSRAATSLAAGITSLESGLESPLTGWLADRLGPRRVVFCGVALTGLGYILMYFVNSLWALYLVWGVVLGTGFNLTGVPLTVAIANWFVKKRGRALGIRWVLSGVLILPLITWLLTTLGWRLTLVIGGIVMWVVGLPLAWFGLKDKRPEFYGLLPDGAKSKEEDTGTDEIIQQGIAYASEFQEVEFTMRQALKTRPFWLLIVAQASQGMASSSLMVHVIPILTDAGLSPARAAVTLTVSATGGMVMRLVGGILADRIKRQHLRFIYGGASLLQASGIIIFLANPTLAGVYPFLFLYFVGFGANLTLQFLVFGRYFGRKAFGSIRGAASLFIMPASVISPVFAGWVYDTTASYTIALTTFVVLLCLAAILMFLAAPPRPPAQLTDVRQIV